MRVGFPQRAMPIGTSLGTSLGPPLVATLLSAALFAATAQANVDISIAQVTSSAGSNPVEIGDTVTIEVRLASSDPRLIGVGLWAVNYDESVADFVSGVSVPTFFSSVAPDGSRFGGFTNRPAHASLIEQQGLFGAGVPFATGLVPPIAGVPGDGSQDIGLDGIPIANGGVHARLTFQITGPGVTSVLFTGDGPGAGVVLLPESGGALLTAPISTSVSIPLYQAMVVPEPSTALLLGLGLAGIAGRRRVREA